MAAEPSQVDRGTVARYAQLAARVEVDLRLLHDAALAIHLPFNRLARVKRAKREIGDELQEIATATKKGTPA
jgi:hypothetical protein